MTGVTFDGSDLDHLDHYQRCHGEILLVADKHLVETVKWKWRKSRIFYSDLETIKIFYLLNKSLGEFDIASTEIGKI